MKHFSGKIMIFLLITILIQFMCKFLHTTSAAPPCGNSNEALYINDPTIESQNKIPLCPAKFNTDFKNMEKKLSHYSELQYCLFKETVPKKNARLCDREVKPVMYIVKDENNEPVRCGPQKDQFFHNFGYIFCQVMNDDQLRNIDSSKLKMIADNVLVRYIVTYTVCYNILKHETIWTRHQVLAIFQDPVFINETYCSKKINDDPYYENSKKYFENLKVDFEKEQDEIIVFPMVPQQLVPAEHFALRKWKETTNHYINVAPIWKRLVPLMNAIDEGIRRAALNLYSYAIKSKIPHNGLIIYTRVKPEITLMRRALKWFFKGERFEPSIWYKFVYDPITQKGVMIHIRNTLRNQTERNVKENNNFCNFEKWTDDEDIRKTILLQLLKSYAYCSKVTSKDIRKLFYTNVKIREEVLDIDTLGTSFVKLDEKINYYNS